jgi:hypothetical protein
LRSFLSHYNILHPYKDFLLTPQLSKQQIHTIMHLPSTLGLLALATTVAASTQAVIHIEVDGIDGNDGFESIESIEPIEPIESTDYFTELAPAQMTKAQADQVCAKGKRRQSYGTHTQLLTSMK